MPGLLKMKGDSSAFKRSIKKILYVNHQEHVQVCFSIHVYADACDRKREETEKEEEEDESFKKGMSQHLNAERGSNEF